MDSLKVVRFDAVFLYTNSERGLGKVVFVPFGKVLILDAAMFMLGPSRFVGPTRNVYRCIFPATVGPSGLKGIAGLIKLVSR